ncbi:GNAT family N-acetyltransferase [Pseudomonas sp. P66]|uniref:GNAT family N-acetyltransferase n=1 Tax=Pseudomonas arcuscaelestis TaxID=2710591 RepID=A0ABS2C8W6_9PSED|nr:GNAT family N-acetyltransferase [Pseudomonas arcuscaelestis]MBM5461509.1 GNAT family N-acetyltransferase [Pseudomonas arcuscaelestis]
MKVEFKTIRLRLVEESDAEFILSLRLNDKYNRYLSAVNADVEAQKSWIRKYKDDEQSGRQYYFIIERMSDGQRCGTVRIYDFLADSFCWGSWILNEDKTRSAALESTLLVYEIGMGKLGFEKSHFDVRKDNEAVVKYHQRMGAEKTSEDDDNYYFEITKEAVSRAREDMSKTIERMSKGR